MPIVQEPSGLPGMGSSQPDAQNVGAQGSEVSYSGIPPQDSSKFGVGGILKRFGIGGKDADPPPLAPTTPTMQQGVPEGVTSADFAASLGLNEKADAGVAAPFMSEPVVSAGPNSSLAPESVAQPPTFSQEPSQMQATGGGVGIMATEGPATIGESTIGDAPAVNIDTPTSAPVDTTPDMGGPTIEPEVQESLTKPASDNPSKGEGSTYDELKVDLLEELRKSLETADEGIKGAMEAVGKFSASSEGAQKDTTGTPNEPAGKTS